MTTWQEVVRADGDLAEWGRTEPVKRAEANGHTVEWDPPEALTAGRRWTCTVCGDAVLIYGHNIYGGATEKTCEESQAIWKRKGYIR